MWVERSRTRKALSSIKLRTRKSAHQSSIIRLDPAWQPKEGNCIFLTFRCEDCGAVRKLVGDHVKIADEKSTVRASIVGDSGWQVSRKRV